MGLRNLVTLNDLAKRLKLSPSAVSQILNGRESCYASAATKERVFRLAQELNYQPNKVARNLRQRSTQTIGVIATGRGEGSYRRIAILQRQAWTRGYHILIAHSDGNLETERLCTLEFLANMVAGVILYRVDYSDLSDRVHNPGGIRFGGNFG